MSIPDNRLPCPYKCEYPGCEFGAHKPKVNWNGDDTAILCASHVKSEVIDPLVAALREARRWSFEIEDNYGEPTKATIKHDDVAVFIGQNWSDYTGEVEKLRADLAALRTAVTAAADLWSREDAGLTLNLAANDLRRALATLTGADHEATP